MRPALLPILALLFPLAAAAQELPACQAQREGMAFCFANKMCLCEYQPGGSLTGRPPGYRWDCGILRPSCDVVPPDTNPQQQPPMLIQPFVTPGLMGQR
jgi:hypothetical protein